MKSAEDGHGETKENHEVANMDAMCPVCGKIFEDTGAATGWMMMYQHQLTTHEKGLRARRQGTSDPTPIIRSIYKAAAILRGRGIYIDLDKELPWSGAPDYWSILRALYDCLWCKVRATTGCYCPRKKPPL